MPSTTSTHHWHLLPHMWLPSLFTARVAHASARPHLLFVYWTPSHPVLPIHRLASTILSPSTLVFALRWIVLIHQQQKHKNACIATLKYKCLCSPSHISFCASCLCTPLQQNSWKVFFFPLVVVSSSSFLIVKPFGLAFASQLQQKYFREGHQWPLC